MDATKLYFGNREVKEFGQADGTDKVWVVFQDGTRESMTDSEWNGGKSETPRQEDLNFDRDRLAKAQQDVIDIFRKYNLRLEDIGTLLRISVDSIQMSIDRAKECAFGQPAWLVRVDDVQKVLDETPVKPTTDVLRQVQGSLLRY